MASIATIGVYGFDRETRSSPPWPRPASTWSSTCASAAACAAASTPGPTPGACRTALDEAGIGYSHLKELAPTTELRQAQYRADARRGEGKRSRTVLAPEYADGYTEEILDRVDLAPIVRWIGGSKAALLCVERDPEACHRSLIAARLRARLGLQRRGPASAGGRSLTAA